MAFKECGNGHIYDEKQHATCPYCNGGGNRIVFCGDGSRTVMPGNPPRPPMNATQAPMNGGQAVGRTVAPSSYRPQQAPVNGGRPPMNVTQAPMNGGRPPMNVTQAPMNGGRQPMNVTQAPMGAGQSVGRTVAPSSYRPQQAPTGAVARPKVAKTNEDAGKTVGIFQKTMQMDLIVGWLVCIEGPDKGKDYRIYAKNNSIGRAEGMDICLKNDLTISRENHARLGFDEKNVAFYLIPGDSVNNIYINDSPIYAPTQLAAYSVIELGETKLLFVPLCNEKFNWKKA